ncbi:MAG TPA: hypothetical protein VEX68_15875 [Bryobacteraceae bacterium]|nr:hypothetical protein [Bryobacteraceae bacterium]
MNTQRFLGLVCLIPLIASFSQGPRASTPPLRDGAFLFDQETFNGNGRTCLTCHSRETGTVSPVEAQRKFALNRLDPLFRHDGSDDGQGHGVQRMLTEATILVEIPLPENVTLADNPLARTVTVRRGIPSTLNTPALDPVLMMDGREQTLVTQARNAIRGHGQAPVNPPDHDLEAIAKFELSDRFFSSDAVKAFARGGSEPRLPQGATESEKRGRTFFEDRADPQNIKVGSCALCHSGPMLDRTNHFFPIPPVGARFQSVAVSELNEAKNPIRSFVFRNPDGSRTTIMSPDPGRALITGKVQDANMFKISPLRGIRRTAPYFHDNSARTLEEVVAHYSRFFQLFNPNLALTSQEQADIVAYLKLLD